MMVIFSSALDPQGVHLVLINTNSLQYNLALTNPTNLSMNIPPNYCSKHHLYPSPASFPSLTGALVPS